MNYMQSAFGSFAPEHDEDAAVKFALNLVLMDDRLDDLARLVDDGNRVAGIEGEPGWMLERRDTARENDDAAYPGWPAGARFRAHVDPASYQLAHPEFFMSRETFGRYLAPAIAAYVAAHPSRAQAPSISALRNALQ